MPLTGAEKQERRRDKVTRINHVDIRICVHKDIATHEKKSLEGRNKKYLNKMGYEGF